MTVIIFKVQWEPVVEWGTFSYEKILAIVIFSDLQITFNKI